MRGGFYPHGNDHNDRDNGGKDSRWDSLVVKKDLRRFRVAYKNGGREEVIRKAIELFRPTAGLDTECYVSTIQQRATSQISLSGDHLSNRSPSQCASNCGTRV